MQNSYCDILEKCLRNIPRVNDCFWDGVIILLPPVCTEISLLTVPSGDTLFELGSTGITIRTKSGGGKQWRLLPVLPVLMAVLHATRIVSPDDILDEHKQAVASLWGSFDKYAEYIHKKHAGSASNTAEIKDKLLAIDPPKDLLGKYFFCLDDHGCDRGMYWNSGYMGIKIMPEASLDLFFCNNPRRPERSQRIQADNLPPEVFKAFWLLVLAIAANEEVAQGNYREFLCKKEEMEKAFKETTAVKIDSWM